MRSRKSGSSRSSASRKETYRAPSLRQPQVSGPCQAPVLGSNDPCLRPLIGREQKSRQRVVGAVVNDDDLEVLERLVEDALDSLIEVRTEVEARDDYRNRRARRSSTLILRAASGGLSRATSAPAGAATVWRPGAVPAMFAQTQ